MNRKIPTFFVRSCEVCGRRLEIPVSLLGQHVNCEHCGATFTAHDPSHPNHPHMDASSEFMQRVELLLAIADNQRGHTFNSALESSLNEKTSRQSDSHLSR